MNNLKFLYKVCARCNVNKPTFLYSSHENVCMECRAEYMKKQRNLPLNEWQSFYKEWQKSLKQTKIEKRKQAILNKQNSDKMRLLEEKRKFNNSPQKKWAMRTRSSHQQKYLVQMSSAEIALMAFRTPYCPFCGKGLDYDINADREVADKPSLDRTDNGIIMNTDNTQIICFKCNTTKSNRTMKQFVDYCTAIAHKYKGE